MWLIEDPIAEAMLWLAAFLALESAALALIFRLKRPGGRKPKAAPIETEYRISEIASTFSLSLTLCALSALKIRYFRDMDAALSSLPAAGLVMFLNIVFRIAGFFREEGKGSSGVWFDRLMKSADDAAASIAFTLTAAALAAQMPAAEISKYFGLATKRAALAELPFLMTAAFIALSNISMVAQDVWRGLKRSESRYADEVADMALLMAAAGAISHYSGLPSGVFMCAALGIAARLIISSATYYLNGSRIAGGRRLPERLKRLYTASNSLTSTLADIIVMCCAIFASLNFGGFYGMAVAGLSMIGPHALDSSLGILYGKSESSGYAARTINNLVLFYIFYEMLEFIARRRVEINLFSNNVVIGLFLSIAFVVFNILKVVNLAKYLETSYNKGYIFARSLIYIALFAACFRFSLPYVNHEMLGAFVLGLVVMTSFISLALVNWTDAREIAAGGGGRENMLKAAVVPLGNQMATLLVVVIILLLPAVR